MAGVRASESAQALEAYFSCSLRKLQHVAIARFFIAIKNWE